MSSYGSQRCAGITSCRKMQAKRPLFARAHNFARRSGAEKLLLVEALVRLVGLRAFLLVYGLKRQPRLYGKAYRPEVGDDENGRIVLDEAQQKIARQVGWAIWRAERLLPFDVVCLPQALVGRRLLQNRGIRSVMYFGVEQGKPLKEVGTHAWLVSGPVKVTGFPLALRYRKFASYPLSG